MQDTDFPAKCTIRPDVFAANFRQRHSHFHFTPTSGSWLNQVERWFGLTTDKMVRRHTCYSVHEQECAMYE